MVQASLARGDATGWFEELYSTSTGDRSRIPWADMSPNPNLLQWLDRKQLVGPGKSALIVGCGLGDDAEELARRGFQVTAFDVAPTAIEWCRKRFPGSQVEYHTADLLKDTGKWHRKFDFVFEAYTIQALPPALRVEATEAVANTVADRGTLLIVTRARNPEEDPGSLPWPLTKTEVDRFHDFGLETVVFEDYIEQEEQPVRRFRVEFRRA